MTTNCLIVRYGEITLKGRNRRQFEEALRRDIRRHLAHRAVPFTGITLERGRIYIHGCPTVPDLRNVLGVLSYSPAREIPCDYDQLVSALPALFPSLQGKRSFRISCQRVNKAFVPDSPTVERQIGEIVQEATGLAVNLERPEVDIQIEIGTRSIFLFFEKIKGFGGFPYGTAGKLVSLISGGIDSPVATFLMMKRGVERILLHYQIWPDEEEETAKVTRLKEKLEEYTSGRKIKLCLVSRDEIFQHRFAEIYRSRLQSYVCLMCKVLMHRRAEEIAGAEGALGLITGDNLAQVASQTLQNMHAQRHWNRCPVYSPLIAFEKNDTIALAKTIGTYDISIGKEKGCQPPRSPKTRVTPQRLEEVLHQAGLLSSEPRA